MGYYISHVKEHDGQVPGHHNANTTDNELVWRAVKIGMCRMPVRHVLYFRWASASLYYMAGKVLH